MRRVSLFILILCCFAFTSSVNAVTDETEISTTTVPVITTTTEAPVNTTTKTTSKKTIVKSTAKVTTTKSKNTTTIAKLEDEVVVLSELETKKEVNKATILVDAAEKSLIDEDYAIAFNSVNKLIDSEEKQKLLKRLEEVKINIAVKEKCQVNDKTECKQCKECNNVPWIVICIGLFLCLLLENIYLVYRKTKMYD